MKFTHYGWFAFCPVRIGGLDTDAPMIDPRWPWLAPVFWLAEATQQITIAIASAMWADYEPVFAIKITGEIR